MSRRTHRKVAQQTLALSLAVPQVVAHRVGRMAAAGSKPSLRDRREFTLMGAEKVAAFYESWAAMGFAALRAQQALAQSMWQSMLFSPWQRAGALPSANALANQSLRIFSQGLAPVQRRATANAKRLARRR